MVEVLLLQGVDSRAQSSEGTRVADIFRAIPHVTVCKHDVGKLGRFDTLGLQRFAKVRDVAHVVLTRRKLVARALEFQPNLVYSAQQRWDLRIATPIARALRVPQVVHLHYIVGPWLGQHAIDTLETTEMVIGVSDYIRDNAIHHGVRADRVHALYNSVDVPPVLSELDRDRIRRDVIGELSLPDDAILVGMVARLSVSKGQVDLVQALRSTLTRDRRVHLLLIGTEYPRCNGLTKRIRSDARASGITNQVHLLGQRSDIPRILDALDVFAHPSLQDPCPLAVLEAGAHGLAVVAWRDGGTETLVVDEETGLLVDPGDIAGLTRALDTIIGDPALQRTLGEKARARVATVYNPDVAGERFLELLQQAAGQSSISRGGERE